MKSITAIILTKNEEKNIKQCINSINKFVERIVVVDSGSKDNTVDISKSLGADVYFNKFDYYAQQFNWAIDNTNITTDWILRLDADERFTPELCDEVSKIIDSNNQNVNGITMEAWLFFLGKKLNYGASKKRKLMIFRNKIGRIEDRKRDAHSIISEGETTHTKEKFLHYDFKDVNDFINKYNYYATREKEDYIDFLNGKNELILTDEKIQKTRKNKFGYYYKSPILIRAWLWFIYNYIFRLGFLDGKEGLIFHFLECYWYRFLVDTKILEYKIEENSK